MIKWQNLPPEIQEKMLERQVEQGNPRNPDVFKKNIAASSISGGFNWGETIENEMWSTVLERGRIEEFYRIYPKPMIKTEYHGLYKKTFRVNRIVSEDINLEKIKELGLTHIFEDNVNMV